MSNQIDKIMMAVRFLYVLVITLAGLNIFNLFVIKHLDEEVKELKERIDE
jgi:hypothetical protein